MSPSRGVKKLQEFEFKYPFPSVFFFPPIQINQNCKHKKTHNNSCSASHHSATQSKPLLNSHSKFRKQSISHGAPAILQNSAICDYVQDLGGDLTPNLRQRGMFLLMGALVRHCIKIVQVPPWSLFCLASYFNYWESISRICQKKSKTAVRLKILHQGFELLQYATTALFLPS